MTLGDPHVQRLIIVGLPALVDFWRNSRGVWRHEAISVCYVDSGIAILRGIYVAGTGLRDGIVTLFLPELDIPESVPHPRAHVLRESLDDLRRAGAVELPWTWRPNRMANEPGS